MKFSNSYIFYPDSTVLDQVLEHYKSAFPELASEQDRPHEDDRSDTLDNTRNTRGSFEQRKYDTATLERVRSAFENLLTAQYREQNPLDWAKAQDSLGKVLATLGQQQDDTELLNLAIQAFSASLEERNQESTPEDWLSTQNILASALLDLGLKEGKSKWLKQAVDIYIEKLLPVWTHSNAPQKWASAMHNLGLAFHTHGKLMQGNRTFQKSVVAYKNALSEWDIEDDPREYAMAQNNRGVVLQHTAEREENIERLEEAIRAYGKALWIWQAQQLPAHLATMVMANRSTALTVLAELTDDASITQEAAQEAVDEFGLIIEVFHSSCHTQCLEHCKEQREKAEALLTQGRRNK